MGRVHVSVVRHLAWVSAANLSPVRTLRQTHSMQDISTSVGVSSVSQHAFCAHGSEWGGKICPAALSVLGFHTWWSQRTKAALQRRTSMRADALNTSDLRLSLRKPTMAVSSNYTCSTSAGREELRLTALCTGQYCRGQRSFKNIFELKSMEVTEERRDTAERIQNIWCFLMTVKVSSYQKVSQRSLHVLSVLHH